MNVEEVRYVLAVQGVQGIQCFFPKNVTMICLIPVLP